MDIKHTNTNKTCKVSTDPMCAKKYLEPKVKNIAFFLENGNFIAKACHCILCDYLQTLFLGMTISDISRFQTNTILHGLNISIFVIEPFLFFNLYILKVWATLI